MSAERFLALEVLRQAAHRGATRKRLIELAVTYRLFDVAKRLLDAPAAAGLVEHRDGG